MKNIKQLIESNQTAEEIQKDLSSVTEGSQDVKERLSNNVVNLTQAVNRLQSEYSTLISNCESISKEEKSSLVDKIKAMSVQGKVKLKLVKNNIEDIQKQWKFL